MSSQTAQSFWDIPDNLKYNEPIDEQSPLFVDTAVARGNFTFNRLYKSLFLDPASLSFKGSLPYRVYQLLLGHRGCGKSTELRRLSHTLHHRALAICRQDGGSPGRCAEALSPGYGGW